MNDKVILKAFSTKFALTFRFLQKFKANFSLYALIFVK